MRLGVVEDLEIEVWEVEVNVEVEREVLRRKQEIHRPCESSAVVAEVVVAVVAVDQGHKQEKTTKRQYLEAELDKR
jgi:hypothetical protein